MTAATPAAVVELPAGSVDKPVEDFGERAIFPLVIASVSIMPKIEAVDIYQ
jgi:hypothetical protein